MKMILFVLGLAACGGDSNPSGPDASMTNDGQHVVSCAGVVTTGAPSNCPHGDCDDRSGTACTAYASFIPGSKTGVCNAGQTGSYGLLFAKSPSDLSSHFYEVVVCTGGTPTLHACASGFHTDANGYDGQPGYVCI